MKAAAILIALSLCLPARAQDPAEATKPLSEGVPEVAVVRLRHLLGTKLSDPERQKATRDLAAALIASHEPAEALVVLDQAVAEPFLRAQALAALGRWSEALPLYQQVAASENNAQARFGVAEAFRALGKTDEALRELNSLASDAALGSRARFTAIELLLGRSDFDGARRLLNSTKAITPNERKLRRLFSAKLEWETRRSPRGVQMFASIAKNPEGATHQVLLAALYGLADAHLALGTPESGDNYLEDYIEHHPGDPELGAVFAKLDQLYAAERRQSTHDLGRWAREELQPRRGLAQWYLARAQLRLGRPEAARAAFAQLASTQPPHQAAGGLLEFARLLLRDGDAEQAHGVLETARATEPSSDLRERIAFMQARAAYAAQQYAEAGRAFQVVAKDAAPTEAKDALMNASLAWLSAGDASEAASAAQDLNARGTDAQTRGDLALEEALLGATRGDKDATDRLHRFLNDFPKHPRVSEAWVVLAELAFRAAPPRLDEARQDLMHANESQPAGAVQERADYLAIWLEEAAPNANEERTIQLANDFLAKHPQSPLVPEVRLKLAETHYRRQDYANAQTQFELLAQSDPNSPLAERAQFFAAKSAMNSMDKAALDRALLLFGEVVKRNSELKWAARNEQAIIERKLNKPQDALTLYDEVLKGDAKPEEKREALCAKGDVLYDLGAANPENYRRAIEFYDELAAQRDAPAHWRNQATFKKGMCLEQLHATGDALATFYGIVENETRPGRRREFFWFYKAGFNAARLLEEEQKWQAAAAVYEKLAFAGGARSEEARGRLDRLRLEHFLWDE